MVAANTVIKPTRIHILWHSWRLPTYNVEALRHDTIALLDKYLGFHYPDVPIIVSFDEEPSREVLAHLDFDYEGLLPSEREGAKLLHKTELGLLIGDVMRYFVASDSYNRMLYSRNVRNADHNRYGLGSGIDTIPYPPSGYNHMPRFPLTFDKTIDGSKLYQGSITPTGE